MYIINLTKKPEKFLKKLDTKEREIIIYKLKQLQKNPELGKPLVGRLSGLWSLRIGKYRAIYQIRRNELLIIVLKLGLRKNVYD